MTIIFVFLFSVRVGWLYLFNSNNEIHIEEGQLDLRNIDEFETITLDGEWNFYPYQFLIDDNIDIKNKENTSLITVPGGWNKYLEEGKDTPFGYGSYHLRILVDPDDEKTYSVNVSSIRSASELYVNNRYLSGDGTVAKNARLARERNIPYIASFTADENGVIDLVIQVSNYKDVRDSGIIRTIKFGEESFITEEKTLSLMLQVIVGIVFLLHGIYALILFFMGHRDKVLLYFSILMTCLVFFNLFGTDEKVLASWIPLSYNISFKLVHLSWALGCIVLLNLIHDKVKDIWRKFVTVLIWVGYVEILFTLILNTTQILNIQSIYLIHSLIALSLTIYYFPKTVFKEKVEKYLIIITFMTLVNQAIWLTYFLWTGIKIMYYPFDIMIGLFALASIWFRRSAQAHFKVEQLAEKLKQEDQLKDEFLANTSHELRNPLHSILNMLNSVLEINRSSLDNKSKQNIELALQMGRHMSLTLDDLLDMMHLKEGRPRLNVKNISLNPIVTGLLDMMKFLSQEKDVTFVNNIQTDFPKVYADENRVIQILFNLLHNAMKYTNKGKVYIDGNVLDNMVEISIIDTGIGMGDQEVKKVFEPYKRLVGEDSDDKDGVGIGLTICKQLVEIQGGTMTISSIVEEGSKFTFTLPVAKSEENGIANKYFTPNILTEGEPNIQQILSNKDDKGANFINRPQILIVDDEPINIQVVKMILAEENYDITSVTNGKKVLKLIHEREWDLIISDVMMPIMSGYELTRLIREKFSVTELPILLLTARSQSTDIQTGFLVGANDYVTKPVEPLELISRVHLLIQVKQSINQQLKMKAAWLQAQIQPHFVFNTLNSITALSEFDLERMRILIDEFAHFLRSKFEFTMIDELHPINDELNIVKSYLYIEEVRYGDRLKVKWKLEDNLESLFIPLLTIQPLVENAIEHGLMTRHEGGTVTIRITKHDTYGKVFVSDNGIGMDKILIDKIMDDTQINDMGVGLKNTHLRLKRFFGEGIRIESTPDIGTTISFKVYKKKNTDTQ